VRECDLEPSLEVLDGQGAVEAEAGGVLEGSPEAFEAGSGVEVRGRGEALPGTEPADRPREDPPPELAAEIGDEVFRGAECPRGGRQETSHSGPARPRFADLQRERHEGGGGEGGGDGILAAEAGARLEIDGGAHGVGEATDGRNGFLGRADGPRVGIGRTFPVRDGLRADEEDAGGELARPAEKALISRARKRWEGE
jgi:hypothetical protein